MSMILRRLRTFLSEIRRRRVGRVAAAYVLGAWVLVEVADTIFPRLLLPDWTVTAVVYGVLVGFPVAVILAWSFDIVADASAERVRGGRRWAGMAASFVVLAGATGAAYTLGPRLAGGGPAVDSLVVLPFEGAPGDADQEYFVAGMHDALIGELSQIGALRVISSRSAQRYSASDKTIPEIARELDVEGVIEGTVTRTANAVQIRVHLIRAVPEERQLWAEAYTRELTSVRVMHGDIARAIAQRIQVALTAAEDARLREAPAVDPRTYEAYLRGMHHLTRVTNRDVKKGLAYLHEAVELNPGDAQAWAGLATGYANLGHGFAPPPGARERARAAALRAVSLDPDLAEAHAARAQVALYFEWDWPTAERAFERAIELNPNLAMAHYHYAWYLALFRRMDEAIVEHRLAQALDPLTPPFTAFLGTLYNMEGEPALALREARRMLELVPENPASLGVLGRAYERMGRYEEAIAAHERLAQVSPANTWQLGVTLTRAGDSARARQVAADIEAQPLTSHSALGLARVYAALGDVDRAIHWLHFEPAHAHLPWINGDGGMAALRDDPRFVALLERMGLPVPSR